VARCTVLPRTHPLDAQHLIRIWIINPRNAVSPPRSLVLTTHQGELAGPPSPPAAVQGGCTAPAAGAAQ
jgi:hypothetical protein